MLSILARQHQFIQNFMEALVASKLKFHVSSFPSYGTYIIFLLLKARILGQGGGNSKQNKNKSENCRNPMSRHLSQLQHRLLWEPDDARYGVCLNAIPETGYGLYRAKILLCKYTVCVLPLIIIHSYEFRSMLLRGACKSGTRVLGMYCDIH